jgi:beta-N-acetylhexosaminidase
MAGLRTTDFRQQVGQLLILGFEGLAVDDDLRTTLGELEPGGVILFARNIEDPSQTWRLLRDCRSTTSVPMFLCVDLEGGTVDRLKKVIAPAPSLKDVFSTSQPKLFRIHGKILGLEARALGFNTDFAPVLDLGFESSRMVLGPRTASNDPKDAINYAREFLRGLKAAEVLGCGKHFPGLGEANLDTHHELPSISKPWKKMWAEDLLPYRQLKAQLPFVMVAHAAYPDALPAGAKGAGSNNAALPASLSRYWMTDVLRRKIGYRGLILSDDLEMGGVLAAGSIEEVAVGTLRAGADMFLVCHNQELVWRAYEAVLKETERDREFRSQVVQAAQRVLNFKKRSLALRRFAAEPKAGVIKRLRQIVGEFSQLVAQEDRLLTSVMPPENVL